MKSVTVSAVNGRVLPLARTYAILLQNCVKWYQNAAGYVVVRYDKKPGSNTQPESLTLNINKATFDALIAAVPTINVLSLSIYDLVTGVKTTTAFNERYIISMEDSKVSAAGTVDASVVEVIYEDGSFITKKVYHDGTMAALVASNGAEILTYAFAAVAGSTATIDALNRTIAATVPFGTTITALVATFTTSASITSIKISSTAQVSGVTQNNFSTPKTYTIIAADGVTTRSWVVTLTVDEAVTTTTTEAATTTTTGS